MLKVAAGPFVGNRIRTARKEGRCQYGFCERTGARCRGVIKPGDHYVEGEIDPFTAGGFGRERWCMRHFREDEVGALASGAEGGTGGQG
jgi:hypothetical protein